MSKRIIIGIDVEAPACEWDDPRALDIWYGDDDDALDAAAVIDSLKSSGSKMDNVRELDLLGDMTLYVTVEDTETGQITRAEW